MAEEEEIGQRPSLAKKSSSQRGSQVAFEGIELQEIRNSQTSEKRKSLRRELGRKLSIIKGHAPYTVKFPVEKHKTKANYIKTTKYSLLSFIPLNLYYQVLFINLVQTFLQFLLSVGCIGYIRRIFIPFNRFTNRTFDDSPYFLCCKRSCRGF